MQPFSAISRARASARTYIARCRLARRILLRAELASRTAAIVITNRAVHDATARAARGRDSLAHGRAAASLAVEPFRTARVCLPDDDGARRRHAAARRQRAPNFHMPNALLDAL